MLRDYVVQHYHGEPKFVVCAQSDVEAVEVVVAHTEETGPWQVIEGDEPDAERLINAIQIQYLVRRNAEILAKGPGVVDALDYLLADDEDDPPWDDLDGYDLPNNDWKPS